MPQAHAKNAASAVINIHRMAVTKHNDYSFASSALTTALLASLGAANEALARPMKTLLFLYDYNINGRKRNCDIIGQY
jgi:hypothetical protein